MNYLELLKEVELADNFSFQDNCYQLSINKTLFNYSYCIDFKNDLLNVIIKPIGFFAHETINLKDLGLKTQGKKEFMLFLTNLQEDGLS